MNQARNKIILENLLIKQSTPLPFLLFPLKPNPTHISIPNTNPQKSFPTKLKRKKKRHDIPSVKPRFQIVYFRLIFYEEGLCIYERGCEFWVLGVLMRGESVWIEWGEGLRDVVSNMRNGVSQKGILIFSLEEDEQLISIHHPQDRITITMYFPSS